MAVQFILGRSGTGKTTLCIESIIEALQDQNNTQPLILLVPEQATYQAERAILRDKSIPGYNRLKVLSFSRLQFLLLGRKATFPELSRTARQMVIQRILLEQRSKLKLLASSAMLPGLSSRIADTIAEFQQYDKSPEDIDGLLEQLKKDPNNNAAVLKFADIRLVFAEYLRFIEGRFTDPDLQMVRARKAVSKSPFVKNAKLWVDGFSSFSTTELGILAELLISTADAKIALCLDPAGIDLTGKSVKTPDPMSLFVSCEKTYAELLEIIKKRKLKSDKPVALLRQVRFSADALAHLERNIFEPQPEKLPLADGIRIFSAPDMRREVQFAAREILALVKEKNFRYRDIAVIASDLDSYQYYIRACFEDLKIPFFIDSRKSLNQHPAIRLVSSALQTVTEGFAHSDIFALLKSGLFSGLKSDDIDLLENYCIAFGVTGRDWQNGEDWNFAKSDRSQFDQARINKIRRHISASLIKLRDSLCSGDGSEKAITAEEFTRSVFAFLDELSVVDTLGRWIDQARSQGDNQAVDMHQQFYNKLVDTFDELTGVFAGCEMTCRDWACILEYCFSQLKLAFIPGKLDQVLVGSIDRSRHPDLKVVFLIGTTQKLFPAPVRTGGLLSDADRIAAENLRFRLSDSMRVELADRWYLAYIAFTRPSRLLTVTYPLANDKGAPNARSGFIDSIETLFDDLRENSIASEAILPETVHTKNELSDLLCRGLGKDAPEKIEKDKLTQLIGQIRTEAGFEKIAEIFYSATSYDNIAQLDKNLLPELFGPKMRSSISRLSTFAKCPYQYFAKYTLGLKERERFELKPLDIGHFYHRVLDALLKRLNKNKKTFADIDETQLEQILSDEISQLIRTDSFISSFISRSRHNDFIIHCAVEALEDCVTAISKMTRAGKFVPVLSEISFGCKEDLLSEYEIKLPGDRTVLLRGIIDRLDTADCAGEKTAIIFDYKSRGKNHKFCRLYYGLDMQLAVYILALRNARSNKITRNVAGAFYMPIEAPPKNSDLNKLSEPDDSFEHKAKGIFNGEFAEYLDSSQSSGWSRFYNFRITKNDAQYGNYNISGALNPRDFENLLKFTESKIADLARSIFEGNIDISPYRLGDDSPCGYCDYKTLCRFDWLINQPVYLTGMDKRQVLEMIGLKK